MSRTVSQIMGINSYDDLIEPKQVKIQVTLREFLDIAWETYPLDTMPERLGQLPEDIIKELKEKYTIKKGSK